MNWEVISSALMIGGFFGFVISGSLGIQTGESFYHFAAMCIIVPSLIHSRWHFNKYHSKKHDVNVAKSEGGKE